MDAPQTVLQSTLQADEPPTTTVDSTSDVSNPTVEILSQSNSALNDEKPTIIKKRRKKKKPPIDISDPQPPSPSSAPASSCSSSNSVQRGLRVSSNRRSPRVLIGSVRQKAGDVEALALPLGMSIAAVVAQVLEKKNVAGERMSVDRLSTICTLAVRESLANVFGNKFDCFVRNFEKSFRSTLMTLRLINESSQNNLGEHLRCLDKESYFSDPTPPMSLDRGGDSTCNSGVKNGQSEVNLHTISTQERLSSLEETEENMPTNLMNCELALHDRQINQQLACVSQSTLHSVKDQYMLRTLQESVMEQTRSNDLKTFEIGLIMKKLKLKETQLALNSDLNILERCKLSMGISKASFKTERFKSQLEDTRHAELLKTCIDCLVAGLLIMLACLAYGAYVYSPQRITEATASCKPTKESKSWWIPKPMASFNSVLQILWCHVQVGSRMLFGLLMIFFIAYLLLQRSAASKQTMPVTFVLLLLGVACGLAGKFCIDTLGGSGYHWLVYWEALCLLHFFSNVCTSTLFLILHGPITVCERSKGSRIFPYWIRRFLFYATELLFLPLLCGFIPFASPGEWKEHFFLLVMDLLQPNES